MITHRAIPRLPNLLSPAELAWIDWVASPLFPLSDVLLLAGPMHAHIRVQDVAALPHSQLTSAGLRPILQRPGFEAWSGPRGEVSFSSIAVSAEDAAAGLARRPVPFLDHIGFDVSGQAPLDLAAGRAAAMGWGVARQGGSGPVVCCFTTVRAKAWIYPPRQKGVDAAIELSWGHSPDLAEMGGDLRPARP